MNPIPNLNPTSFQQFILRLEDLLTKSEKGVDKEIRNKFVAFEKEWGELLTQFRPSKEQKNQYQSLVNKLTHKVQQLKEDDQWLAWGNLQQLQNLLKKMSDLKSTLLEDMSNTNIMSRTVGEAKSLLEEWKKVGVTERDRRDKLWTEFIGLKEEIDYFAFEKKAQILQQIQEVIAPFQNMENITLDWAKKHGLESKINLIKNWQRQLKEIGHLPAILEKKLPQNVRLEVNNFFEKLGSYQELKLKQNEHDVYQKQKLIHEAEKLVRKGITKENVSNLHQEMQKLMSLWKEISASGSRLNKKISDELWEKFLGEQNKVQTFFQNYKIENLQAKQSILQQLEQNPQNWKELSEQFNDLGPVREDEEQRLNNCFKEALQKAKAAERMEKDRLLEKNKSSQNELKSIIHRLIDSFHSARQDDEFKIFINEWNETIKASSLNQETKLQLDSTFQTLLKLGITHFSHPQAHNDETSEQIKQKFEDILLEIDVLSRLIYPQNTFPEIAAHLRAKQLFFAVKLKQEVPNEKKLNALLKQWSTLETKNKYRASESLFKALTTTLSRFR